MHSPMDITADFINNFINKYSEPYTSLKDTDCRVDIDTGLVGKIIYNASKNELLFCLHKNYEDVTEIEGFLINETLLRKTADERFTSGLTASIDILLNEKVIAVPLFINDENSIQKNAILTSLSVFPEIEKQVKAVTRKDISTKESGWVKV